MIIAFMIPIYGDSLYWGLATSIGFVLGMIIGIGYTVTAPDDAYYHGDMDTHPHLWFNMVMTHFGVVLMSTSGLIALAWFVVIAVREGW